MNVTSDDIVQQLIQSWSTSTNQLDAHARILRGQLNADGSLSQLLHWQLALPAVFSYDPVTKTETLGLGSVYTVEATGPEMLGEVKEKLSSVALADGLSWFGALSFDSNIPQSGIWEGMPHAMWFVPKLTLTRRVLEGRVDFVYVDDTDAAIQSDIEMVLSDWLRGYTCNALHSEGGNSPKNRHERPSDDDGHDTIHTLSTWTDMVDEALQAIEAGDLRKVVLARQTSATVSKKLSQVMANLLQQYPANHVFALYWRERFLIGASPEELARVDDGYLQVDCLAGSTARGATDEEDKRLAASLLTSSKNRHEHAAVVEFVADRLKLVADEIDIPDAPSLKRLANVQHLHTPVSAKLADERTILDVVELLHPTPAVGGAPRHAALDFIRTHENWARGFYAGAFGCMDGHGNGLFSVALRTAAVRHQEARLFAGCGIVDGSDAHEEWRETEMKLQPMRLALG